MADGSWDELELLPHWGSNAREAQLIFDVGGFNGIYGILAKKINPAAKVFIFEPDPVNAAHIRKNASLNGVAVTLIEAVVTDHAGTTKFSANGSTGSRVTEWGAEMRCVELRDYGSADLLKIDVEGHELEVLRGADLSRTKRIFIEENQDNQLKEYKKEFQIGLTSIYKK